MAGISYKYSGEIERGETNPSIDTLTRIAHGLNIPLEQIIKTESVKSSHQKVKRYAESHPYFFVNDHLVKLLPRDEKKQKLIIQAIRLFRRAFGE